MQKLDLDALRVESYVTAPFAAVGLCTNPRCTVLDLLDEWGACSHCEYIPGSADFGEYHDSDDVIEVEEDV